MLKVHSFQGLFRVHGNSVFVQRRIIILLYRNDPTENRLMKRIVLQLALIDDNGTWVILLAELSNLLRYVVARVFVDVDTADGRVCVAGPEESL